MVTEHPLLISSSSVLLRLRKGVRNFNGYEPQYVFYQLHHEHLQSSSCSPSIPESSQAHYRVAGNIIGVQIEGIEGLVKDVVDGRNLCCNWFSASRVQDDQPGVLY